MIAWRICRSKFVDSAFQGTGAERVGGRWNRRGSKLIYASENLSLATLELFVHVSPKLLPPDLVAIRAELPKGFSKTEIEISSLPKNWRDYPAPVKLQQIGTDWTNSNSTLALIVPSAVNPIDRNILLNPAHPEMRKVAIGSPARFVFDPRMFK